MGFNLGAFASGFAQGGVNSYKMLNDMQEQKARAAREQATFERQQTEWAKQDEADRLMQQASQERGVAGTGQALPQALGNLTNADTAGNQMTPEARAELAQTLQGLSPEQAQQALRAYGNAFGAPQSGGVDLGKAGVYKDQNGQMYATNQTAKPTAIEAAQRYQDLAAASGNRVAQKEAQAGLASQYSLENAGNEYKVNQEFGKLKTSHDEEMLQLHTDVKNTFAKEGGSGIIKKYGSLYNQETGNTIKLVGNNAVVTDSKGKPVGQPIPVDQLPAAVDSAMSAYYTDKFTKTLVDKNLFPDARSAIAYQQKQMELHNQGISANAAATSAAAASKNADTNAMVGAAHANYFNEAAKKSKQTASEAYKEKLDATAQIFLDADPTLTPEAAKKKAALEMLHSPEARANVVSMSDINAFIKENQENLVKPDPNQKGKTIPMTPQEKVAAARAALGGAPATGGLPDLKGGLELPGAAAALPTKPAGPDEMVLPTRKLNEGYGVPDGRALLRTPNYNSGKNTFNPVD